MMRRPPKSPLLPSTRLFRACSLLFDRPGGAGHRRLIPDRRLRLDGFALDDALWEELRVPVDMAFFVRDTAAERVSARSEEHTSELQSRQYLVCRLLLQKQQY